jgi:hypothetical protein
MSLTRCCRCSGLGIGASSSPEVRILAVEHALALFRRDAQAFVAHAHEPAAALVGSAFVTGIAGTRIGWCPSSAVMLVAQRVGW